ncbi:nucleotidyltransferase family protein [Parabacteroides sp. AM08-6]|uniref:nucleotidyltransferase family protein n=1 Tax=Parabacteroides sp. AM08-6 TaxID=2292053 RepID=UPI001F36632B|nr:nucleotidyltransferase domain-containing protein [Parabacteroides sp. AM08-6]
MAENAIDQTMYGIPASEWELINKIFSRSPHVKEVILFGSRAKGTFKTGSDIDFAIKGTDITKDDISSLVGAFEESVLPYFVDVILYSSIHNEALKEHIDRVGIPVYSSQTKNK